MTNVDPLGPCIRRFLLEYIISERNQSRNTQASYRDTLTLLIPFVGTKLRRPVDQLSVSDLNAEHVRSFLATLEQTRGCGAATRNVRLAAIRSLARFVAERSPEHIGWSGEICSIPFKKADQRLVPYLENQRWTRSSTLPTKPPIRVAETIFSLLFLYNTGARVSEAAQLIVGDLNLATREQDYSSVTIRGKGNKFRCCPLWPQTVTQLRTLIGNRAPKERVFLNRRRQGTTRSGIYLMVERYVTKIAPKMPSLTGKRVSPHCIRHTTATHLLRSGVDINTIRAWLGHVSLETTNVYAEVDLEMKAKALALCDIGGPGAAEALARQYRTDGLP
jgi:integrase/recombinase XerD